MKKIFELLFVFSIFGLISCSSSNKTSDDSDIIPDADSDDLETVDEDNDSNEEEEKRTCTGISVDWATFGLPGHSYMFDADIKTNIGDPDTIDVFELSFPLRDGRNFAHIGTFELGTGDNDNYATCTECAVIFQDYVPYKDPETYGAMGYWSKIFFQKSGTLEITDQDVLGEIEGKISVKLVEVTIDPEKGFSTPVDDGECYEIESGSFDSGLCHPDCNGKICGDNGCSGSCGSCGDLACSADRSACIPWECETIEGFEKFTNNYYEFASFPHFYESFVTGNALGDTSIEDSMVILFRKDTPLSAGTFELIDHIGLCDKCIYLYEDDPEYDFPAKQYFQQSGELVFEKVDEETFDSKGHGSMRLIEYAKDSHYNFIPVPGGKCYEIPNFTWDTFCYPQCDGKICGDDGCGGTCGTGCSQDEYCNAEQTECLPYENCTKITLGAEYDYYYYYDYASTYTPGAGDPEIDDLFAIDVRTPIPPANSETQYSISEFDLYKSAYNDCNICVFVYEDYEMWSDSNKTYFQQSGKITFRTKEDLTTHDIEVTATIEGLRLVESDADSFDPITGGSCLEVNDTVITYTIEHD